MTDFVLIFGKFCTKLGEMRKIGDFGNKKQPILAVSLKPIKVKVYKLYQIRNDSSKREK